MTLTDLLERGELPVPEAVRASDARAADKHQTVLIWGPQGVGKTTLFNAITGREEATGLGGVTTSPHTELVGNQRFIDLPPLDELEPDEFIAPWALAADVAVLVTDGLRALGTAERRAVDRFTAVGVPVPVLVGRRDLIAGATAEVLERVKSLLPVDTAVFLVDVRTAAAPQALAAVTRAAPKTARDTLRHAAALTALALLGDGIDARALEAALLEAWHHHVAAVQAALTAQIDGGALPTPRAVLERLGQTPLGPPLSWPGHPAELHLAPPPPAIADEVPATTLLDRLAGRRPAHRALSAACIDWLTEGRLHIGAALAAWHSAHPVASARAAARSLAREQRDRALPAP